MKAGRYCFLSEKQWDEIEESQRRLAQAIENNRLKPNPQKAQRYMDKICEQYLRRTR